MGFVVDPSTYKPTIPTGWRSRYLEHQSKLERILCITHPAVRKILEVWNQLDSTRLFSSNDFRVTPGPYRYSVFKSILIVQAERCREKLLKQWYMEVLRFFYEYMVKSRRKSILGLAQAHLNASQKEETGSMSVAKVFDCANTLVRNQIIASALSSLENYLSLFDSSSPNYTHLVAPSFLIRASLDAQEPEIGKKAESSPLQDPTSEIRYEPPMSELEEGIVDGLFFITRPMEAVPMIQSVIYSDAAPSLFKNTDARLVGVFEQLKVKVNATVTDRLAARLKEILNDVRQSINEYMKTYDEHIQATDQAQEVQINEFFCEEHSFDEYSKVSKRVHCDMFLLQG
jgi:dynein heavy chain